MAKKRKPKQGNVASVIAAMARRYGLDPDAVLAVARGEGGLVNRPGTQDIGDLAGGGSYGPFQLYAQGALPSRLRGNRNLADQWAWSPEGISYALQKMVAAGAKGKRGRAAVETIIRRFERPADPDSSVRNALARLGSTGNALLTRSPEGPRDMPGTLPTTNSNRRSLLLQGLMQGTDLTDILLQMHRARASEPGMMASPNVQGVTPGSPMQSLPQGFGVPRELIYDPLGSVFDGVRSNKAYGGHGSHVHYAPKTAQEMLRAIALAQRLGLAVRENPFADRVDPVHTKGSHHYQLFPGKYRGKRLGRAADISGNPQKLASFYRTLAGLH